MLQFPDSFLLIYIYGLFDGVNIDFVRYLETNIYANKAIAPNATLVLLLSFGIMADTFEQYNIDITLLTVYTRLQMISHENN